MPTPRARPWPAAKLQEATTLEEETMEGIASVSDARTAENLSGRLFQAALGFGDLLHVYIGDRLGLYRTLANEGPATSAELARRAGIDERYAREWLEQQAV